MLKIAVTEHNNILEEIVKSFPAKLLTVAEDLIQDLIRSGRVDVAFIPYSTQTERKFTHRTTYRFADQVMLCAASISSENQIILEDFRLRLETTFNAANKYLLRMVASAEDVGSIQRLLKASYLTDVFMVESNDLVRFETVTELAAFYDILAKLREAGARQISLIQIEKYY